MSLTGIRVPLVVPGSKPELAAIEQKILSERGRISLLYQVLLNSEPIVTGWEQLLTAVRNKTSVAGDLREMIILRVAVLNNAEFEFEAHIPHAIKAGVSEQKIEALKHDISEDFFNESERLILDITDHMTKNVDVPSGLMERLCEKYLPNEVVEIIATIAAYNMVSRFLVALNIKH